MTRFQLHRRLPLLLIAYFLSASIGSAQDGTFKEKSVDQLAKLVVPNTLVVATREVPPFAMRNEDNQWHGISIDLMREVIAELESKSGHEVNIEFKDIKPTRTIQAKLLSCRPLLSGRITPLLCPATVPCESLSIKYYSARPLAQAGTKFWRLTLARINSHIVASPRPIMF